MFGLSRDGFDEAIQFRHVGVSMKPLTSLTSSCVVLPAANVDTDQIIPARFLKTISRRGLGAHLFADWRLDEKGQPRDLKVVRPLGLGLDQKAIEAVQKWRFKPGLKDGRPVSVSAQIEVNFRLL